MTRLQWGAFGAGAICALALALAGVVLVALLHSGQATEDYEIADEFGVSIIWDTSLIPMCGDYGCHSIATPDVIYVSPKLSPEETRRIVLHELAHVLQWRLGVPMDECAADQFAASLGSAWGGYCASEDRR